MRIFEGFEKGVNLGGWLSQCDYSHERFENFIKEEDIARIAGWGLDHVRIPVDYNLIEDKEGQEKPEGYQYLDRAMAWCQKYQLHMVLDLHKTYGFSFDSGEKEDGFFENEAYQQRFYDLWQRLARRYSRYKDILVFELLNEVTDEAYGPKWNQIALKAIAAIRKIDSDVRIIIGGYHNNSIEAIRDLPLPPDENIIYTFHCYEPLIFTHQGAYWIPTMDTSFRTTLDNNYGQLKADSDRMLWKKAIGYAGCKDEDYFSSDYFEGYFAEAVRIAEERNVPLYCGEYGVINLADPEDTIRWYEAINKVFERYHIARSSWSYKEMDFGLIDEHLDGVRERLLKLL